MAKVIPFLAEQPQSNAKDKQLADLTPREQEVLAYIAKGLDNSTISEQLGLQEKTVRNHITHIFDKLAVDSRAQAIVLAIEAGLGKNRTD